MKSSATNSFAALLKHHKQSVTNPRLMVFEALLGQEPMSMRQLTARAQGVDRASVYRAIELFERLGVVQRLHSGWKYRLELTDRFAPHHHHLTCVQCGATTAISESALEQLVLRLAQGQGFKPTAHQIEIQGLCALCQQQN